MPAWNKRRAARLIRDKKGRFKRWTGGATKAQLAKKQNNYHGIQTHIGQMFRSEHGRAAKTGDIHRTRNKNGSYNKQAVWYIKTPKGWRKSPTMTRKPTPKEIRRVIAAARTGRRA